MENCPHCDGSGEVTAFINRGPDISKHSIERHKCRTCGGAGKISDEAVTRIIAGKRMRDARVSRRESLGEAATRMGMSSAQLSAIEMGRGPADAYTVGMLVSGLFPVNRINS